MKCLRILSLLLPASLLLLASLLLPVSADARIGESRESFERRLFSNGGIIYRDKEGRLNRKRSGVYAPYLKYLGNSAEVRVYYKSDDGRKPMQDDLSGGSGDSRNRDKKSDEERRRALEEDPITGWEVHVLYINGRSVLEQYKRDGSMSDYELNALLAVLGDGKFWEEKPEEEIQEEPLTGGNLEPPDTLFGYEFVRSDGQARASKAGGGLLVFQTAFDQSLARLHEGSLINQAPQSVRGF